MNREPKASDDIVEGVDAHAPSEQERRRGLAGAEAKPFRDLDSEKREEAEKPGQTSDRKGPDAGDGGTGAAPPPARST